MERERTGRYKPRDGQSYHLKIQITYLNQARFDMVFDNWNALYVVIPPIWSVELIIELHICVFM